MNTIILLLLFSAVDDCNSLSYAQNPLHTFPRNYPISWQLVADLFLLATRPTSPQQVVVMEFGEMTRHKQTQRTFALANLLRTCYMETDEMDFGLQSVSKSVLLNLFVVDLFSHILSFVT